MEVVSKIFTKVLLNDYVKIHPKSLNKNTKDVILNKLKQKVEGVCTKHGYIKKDSISIHKITPGRIELVGLNGYAQYNVYFYAEVCNPLVNSLIKCTVVNINKFGILAIAGFYSNSEFVNVLDVIITKNSVNIVSDVDLEKIAAKNEIIVEVLGKRYNLGDKKLSVLGRVVDVKDIDASLKKKKVINNQPEIEDEDEIEEAIIDDADEDDGDNDEKDDERKENEEIEEEDEEKSSKGGGAFFSDNDSVVGDEEYNMYESDDDNKDEESDDDI